MFKKTFQVVYVTDSVDNMVKNERNETLEKI